MNQEVIQMTALLLKVMAFYQVFDAANIVFAVRSTERRHSVYYGGCCWGICIGLHSRSILPCLYAGSPPLGAWLGCMVYLVTLAFVCFVRFRRGHWKSIRLGTAK